MIRPMPKTIRRLLVLAGILGFLYFAGGALRESIGIEFDVESVRVFVQGLGPMAPLLFIFIVAGRSLLWLPSQVVLIVAGLCFGTLLGALVGGAGLMLSGLFLFSVARYAGRDVIERSMGERVQNLFAFTSRRSGAAALALAAAYPLTPLSPLHAAAGWTPMPVPNFIIAAFIGGMLRAGIFAYFGHALTEASLSSLVAPLVLFAFAIGVPLTFSAGRAWLRDIFAPAPAAVPGSATQGAGSGTAVGDDTAAER